jgi:VanZ family protein
MPAFRSPEALVRTAAAAVFVLLLAFILWGSLTPVTAPGGGRYDKLQHFAAYALLTAAGMLAVPRRAMVVLVVVALLGAGVEALQGLLPIRRSASLLDLAANLAGAGLSLLLARMIGRARRR